MDAIESQDFTSRRKHERHSLRNAVHVIDKATGQSVGTVANLSLEGLMLVNSTPLHADCIYQLSLTIAESVLPGLDGGVHDIPLGVDCLWSSPAQSASTSAYWSGCQIIDVSESDFELIKKLISSLAE
ncbi:MAG TPA: PilZ domain-containing protein [Pseudomonadales bacterium]|nr:PilZ domain-containing protein [Pseudomonadales bacterium]